MSITVSKSHEVDAGADDKQEFFLLALPMLFLTKIYKFVCVYFLLPLTNII